MDTYHPDMYSYVRKDVRIRVFFFVAKRGTRTKNLGNTAVDFGQNICLYSAKKFVNTTPIPMFNLNVSSAFLIVERTKCTNF